MNSNHSPQAAAGITQSSSKEITTCSLWRRGQGTSPTLHSRAVVGALLSAAVPSPEVFLPGPFVTIPSSGPAVGSALAAYPRWLVAEFEQEVLYERGLAQVGFGVLPLLSLYFLLSKRLTVCLTWFDLVRATAAHRTLSGLISDFLFLTQGSETLGWRTESLQDSPLWDLGCPQLRQNLSNRQQDSICKSPFFNHVDV